MNRDNQNWHSTATLWWIFIILAAGVIYFSGITHESIWYDEAYTAMMAGHSLPEIISLIKYDNHPPLYYLLTSIIVSIFGNSELALRSLSALAAVALVGLGAGPVRRIFGNKKAYFFSIIVLFTPIILTYAHEARSYTLAILCVTASALFGFLAAQDNKRSDWVYFGISSLAAAYFHYYGLIAAGFMHLYIFLWLVLKKRAYLKSWIITGLCVFLGYLPFLVVLISQTLGVKKGFWIGPLSMDAVLAAFIQPFTYKEIFPTILPTSYMALALSVGLIIFGLVYSNVKKLDTEWSFVRFVVSVYLCTTVMVIVFSLVFQPIFYSRYMLVIVGLFLLLVFMGISMLPGLKWQIAALVILGCLNVFMIKDIYTQYFNYPFKEVAEYLKDEIKPGDLIVTSDSYSMGPAVYYFPQATHYYSNNSIEAQWGQVLIPYGPLLHGDEDREKLLSEHSSLWYITASTGVPKNIATLLKGKNTWDIASSPVSFSKPTSFVAFTITKYADTGKEINSQKGTINLHITGLKPAGNLAIYLFTKLGSEPKVERNEYINITGSEMTYAIDGLDRRGYIIVVLHDENKNHIPDYDKNGFITEGFALVNIEKVDLSSGLFGINFDDGKVSLTVEEMTVEAHMEYPPFPAPK